VNAQGKTAVDATEAVALLKFQAGPVQATAVHPVEASTRIRDADGELVFSRTRGGGEIAFEWQLLHDRVTDQLLVQINLGPLPRTADVKQDALAGRVGRNLDLAPPPRDAVVRAIAHLVVGRFEFVFVVIGPETGLAPFELLDRRGQSDFTAGAGAE